MNELCDLTENVRLLLPHVDTLTIVDGGSIDGTIPTLRNWCKQETKMRFFIHPWRDNFPEQRNRYLDRIREIAEPGDWVLAVDPDEYIEEGALQQLKRVAEVVSAKPEGYRRVGFQCRSVSYRGPFVRCWENLDSYWKGLFFQWHGGLRYDHDGEGAVHEKLIGADPIYLSGHHPEFPAFLYEHRKQDQVVWPRGARNFFCGGGGMNRASQNPKWVEIKKITDRLGLATWSQFNVYLLAGNIDGELKDWIIRNRNNSGYDGASEEREVYKTAYRMYHPEQEPVELRNETIE